MSEQTKEKASAIDPNRLYKVDYTIRHDGTKVYGEQMVRGGDLTEKQILSMDKPRTKFCWHCGRQLRANFHREFVSEDGHTYIVHAECLDILKGEIFDHKMPIDDEGESEWV